MKYLPLVLRNLGRNKLRSILTGATIALAIALVCALRTMPAGLDGVVNSIAANTRISTHNQAGIVYSLPYAYLNKVRGIPGVVAALSWQWFGGAIDPTKGVSFPNFAVDPEAFGQVYADWKVDPKALDDFRKYRDSALVGRRVLNEQKWKVGDVVTLQSTVFPVNLSFRIVGEIPVDSSNSFYFQREYLVQALAAVGGNGDQTGMIWTRVDDPERVNGVMREIDEMFKNSDAETASETEKDFIRGFFGSLKQLIYVIEIVTGVVTLCIVFVAANTASMSVRERIGEIAVLKAIGFRKRTVFSTLLAEAVMLSTAAGAVGALSSLGLTLFLRKMTSTGGGTGPQLGPLTGFVITDAILIQSLFVAFFIGIISGWLPALGASRRSVAATLREVF
ncbi:MAG TPA: ABC transporter permease [Myxococcota bacterium]|nr:ABC transporter permease [Myxococcota bacterium]